MCAPSNTACDELTLRLLKVLQKNEIFRMYAQSVVKSSINEHIVPISNLIGGQFRVPSLDFVYKFRVVVCTVSTSAYFMKLHQNPHFNSNHLGYLFIDESAFELESVTLIPIVGVCTKKNEIVTKIVLSGDPNQLDAVVQSTSAKELGFSTSFMENLFRKKCYQRDQVSRQFNPNYVVQLTKNYRNHPEILKIPNRLFYENVLEAILSG